MTSGGEEGQDLDVAIDVAEINFAAIRRENQPRIAELTLLIWIENLAGRNLRLRFGLVFSRKGKALQNFSINRVNNNQLACFAGDSQELAIRGQGHSLRPHSMKLDLVAVRS